MTATIQTTDTQPESRSSRRLASFIEARAPLFVLTGAGCSTGSGIPDYRDDNGEWKHTRPVQFSDFLESEHTRRRYWARSLSGWPRVARSRPNSAHHALARLERAGVIDTVCTQNVDMLHQKAGSAAVIDLHGRLDAVECLDCDARYPRATVQEELLKLNPGYGDLDAGAAPDGDAHLLRSPDDFIVLKCSHCGGILKPGVVFFGENVPPARVTRATTVLGRSGGMLVVGSSLMVYSGFRFCRLADKHDKPVAVLNRGKTRADAMLELKLSEDCGAALQQVADLVIGR